MTTSALYKEHEMGTCLVSDVTVASLRSRWVDVKSKSPPTSLSYQSRVCSDFYHLLGPDSAELLN
jgi:hypothetical protein